MKVEVDIRLLIENLKMPTDNKYFEKSSADGYAFLGAARAILNLPSKQFKKEVIDRNLSLNAQHRINKRKLPQDTSYTYTLWTCHELARELGGALMARILKEVKEIGRYDTGWQRYCSNEIFYTVPNVCSAAALIYHDNREMKLAKELIDFLVKEQIDGNWHYHQIDRKDGTLTIARVEDKYHLAMMLYHFSMMKSIVPKTMLKKTLRTFVEDGKWLSDGSVGWGVPLTCLVYHVWEDEIRSMMTMEELRNRQEISGNKTIEYLFHENFRVRAISAWVIAKIC